MMYVPVELAPPNVQKSVTTSLHSSYGKLSNIAPPYAPTLVVGPCPLVAWYASSRIGPGFDLLAVGHDDDLGHPLELGEEVLLELGQVEALELDLGRNAQEVRAS